MAIRTFGDRNTERFWNGTEMPRKFRAIARQAARRLNLLNEATRMDDLRNLASNHFEALQGDRKGSYSIRINQKSRFVFRWDEKGPFDARRFDYGKDDSGAVDGASGRVSAR